MTAQDYLCPHCGARNSFSLDENPTGVVVCAQCLESFLLPEFSNSPGPLDLTHTAIVEVPQEPGGFDARDTEIVRLETSPSDGNTKVAGSDSPTLLVFEPVNDPKGANPNVDGAHSSEGGVGSQQTVDDSSDITYELPVLERETVDDPEVPPASAIDTDKVDTKATQPTGLADRNSTQHQSSLHELRVDEEILERPLSCTTVHDVGLSRMAIMVTTGSLLALIMAVSVYWAGSLGGQSEAALALLEKGAVERADTVASLVESYMLAHRPDLARKKVRTLGADDRVMVLKPNYAPAFVDGDWTTYQSVLSKLCESIEGSGDAGAKILASTNSATQWLRGSDSRLSSLGNKPCTEYRTLDEFPQNPLSGFSEQVKGYVSASDRPHYVSWVSSQESLRRQFVAKPIPYNDACVGCHSNANQNMVGSLGWVVVTTDLDPVDAVTARNVQSLWIVGGISMLLAVMVLLTSARMLSAKA